MKKQKANLNVLKDAKINFLYLQEIRGGGPEEPVDDDSWSKTPGKP